MNRPTLLIASVLITVFLVMGCASYKPHAYTPAPTDCYPAERADRDSRSFVVDPGTRPADEIWVIAKPTNPQPAPDDDQPGTGQLATTVTRDGKPQIIPVPLKHTAVRASVSGYISSTTVTQQFTNPFAEKIEAVYVFPLPESAAINEFVMTIGSRTIRGIIREREEAKQIYNEAKTQGYVAGLMTQERPNIFTQKVANIEPDKAIDVQITYYHTLAYADGWYEWTFPMVVGPRYNPAGSTNGVGAAARNAPGSTGQSTEVQYLRPEERSGHDISLTLDLNAPVTLEEIACTSHKIAIERPALGRALVSLAPADRLPNKDFVLRYRVAGDTIKTGMIAHRDQNGGYFSIMVFPPLQLQQHQRDPVEMVFLVDTSGSMHGDPINQSKSAMRYALSHMDLRDTFQVIAFSGSNRALFTRAQPVTPDNIAKATACIDHANAGGGTEMLSAISAALAAPWQAGRQRFVTFLTDGFVGDEDRILLAVHENLGDARIFAFGVGSSPNRYLMDGLARIGRGAVAYLGLRDSGEEIMKAYFDRISHPALTDLRVDFGAGMTVSELYPTRKTDLFVGRPVILTGRFTGELPASVQLHGNVAGRDLLIPVHVDRDHLTNPALAAIWARHKITDLSDHLFYTPAQAPTLQASILQTALQYHLLSQLTAFVAVDASTRTAGEHGTTVVQPVPEGVRYDTTVTEK